MRQDDEVAKMTDARKENVRFNETSEESKHNLASTYIPLLWSLAYRLVSKRTAAEELVQAGYMGLLCAIERYDPMQHTRLITYAFPWILGEMKRAMREMYDIHKDASLDDIDSVRKDSLVERITGCEEIDFAGIDLRIAMKKLNPDEQMVICLRYFRDKTQKETAALMKKSQPQISRLERTALDRLKEFLS